MISLVPVRRMTSAISTERDGSPLARKRPSSISTSVAAMPRRGEAASRFARSSNFAVMLSAAPRTAEPTLEVVHEPPWAGAWGCRVSPSSNFTWSSRSPRNSAAIMVITVYVPGPISLVALVTLAVPSAR
ncbi:hypothetical protein D3C86_1593890 [compost metagenome]